MKRLSDLNASDFREMPASEFNMFGSLVDGNCSIVGARWIVTLDERDDQPVLGIRDYGEEAELFGVDFVDAQYYGKLPPRYFCSPEGVSDDIWDAYLAIIVDSSPEDFFALFDA